MKLIAVTGATGFIGARLCQGLCEAGYAVRALVRSAGRARELLDQRVEPLVGDLGQVSSIESLISGADAVIHCAGQVRGSRAEDFYRVNVDGSRRLFAALAASSPTPYLLHLSSLAAREPKLSFYAASKRDSERLLEQEFAGLPSLVLRPPAVYGPGDRELLPLFRLMARGIAPLPGAASARLSLLHVDDLVQALLCCLACEPRPRGSFELDDGQAGGYDWREIAALVGEICQRRVHLVPIPPPLLDTVAFANRYLARARGALPMLTPEKLRELRHRDWVSDGRALQRASGWRPRYPLRQGLAATKGWR